MIRPILVTALAGVTLLLAADPTGTWTGDQPGRDGNTYNITFKLKAEGTKLTGKENPISYFGLMQRRSMLLGGARPRTLLRRSRKSQFVT